MQNSTVDIRDAKIHLSRYLKIVQQGNEVILTDRGRPVGKIIPMQINELPLSDRLKKMEEQGQLDVLSDDYKKKSPSPIPVSGNIAQVFLREDRENG